LLEELAPLAHLLLDLLPPPAPLLALEVRQEGAQGFRAVSDQVHFHRIAQSEHPTLDVDLYAARLAFLGEEFGIRERRPDHEEGVAPGHHFVARLAPEEPDGTGHEGKVV